MADVYSPARSPLLSVSFFFFSLCLLSPVVGSGTESFAVRSRRSEPDLCPGQPRRPPEGCHINCFRADPVCGANGITYWCGCPDAQCAGTRVVSLGPCAIRNAVGATVSTQAFFWPLLSLGVSFLFGLL